MGVRIIGIGVATAIILAGCGVVVDGRATRAETAAETRWPPVGRFVEVNGTRVHYVQQGQGPDVVLLHGASGNLRDFTFDLVDRLAQSYRVTAFDRPGLGYTGRADPSYENAFTRGAESPQEQAALLAAAASQIGVKAPVVVGHSFGGAVAMAWGLDHDASGVVSLGGAIMPWPGGLDRQYRIVGSSIGGAVLPPFVAAFANPDETAGILSRIFAPQAAPEGYQAHVGPGLSLRRATIRANGKQVNSLRPALVEMSKRYPAMPVPVELIHGTADTIVGLAIHSETAEQILPQARLTRLEGVGHMPHHARPGAVVEAVRRLRP